MFLKIASLIRTLRSIPIKTAIRVELTINHLDHTTYEAIEDWRRGHIARNGSIEIHRTKIDQQLNKMPLQTLLAKLAAEKQQPTHLFITYTDSQIVPTMITTNGP